MRLDVRPMGGGGDITVGREEGTSRGGGSCLMGFRGLAALASSFILKWMSFNWGRRSLKAGRSSGTFETHAMAMEASSGGVSGGKNLPNVSYWN